MAKVGYETGMLPIGSRIVTVVSQGPAPADPRSFVEIPDVVGKSQGAALDAVAKAALQTQVIYDHHTTVRKGMVMAQLPEGGASVPVGAQAVVMVSSGAGPSGRQMAKLPSVVGLSEAEATGVLAASGFEPRVLFDHSPTVPAGIVISQLPDLSTYTARRPERSPVATVVVLVALLALAIAGYWFWSASQRVEVPDVIGMTAEDATATVQAAGLEIGVVSEIEPTDTTGEPGTIAESDPPAGEQVAEGTRVNLKVIAMPGKAEVPYVVGQREDAARAVVEGAGFTAVVQYRDDPTAEPGSVLSQTPSGGSEAQLGSTVTLTVSSGTGVVEVQVPNVTGLKKDAAQAALAAAKLDALVVESTSADVPAGVVITQSPTQGSMVPEGTAVVIVVSTGPAEDGALVDVPDVIGDSFDEARAKLEALGFSVQPYPADATTGSVIDQMPGGGERSTEGSVILLVVE